MYSQFMSHFRLVKLSYVNVTQKLTMHTDTSVTKVQYHKKNINIKQINYTNTLFRAIAVKMNVGTYNIYIILYTVPT